MHRAAAGLQELGVSEGGVIVSDLPNVAENLVLQLACSHLGAGYASVKDAAGMANLRDALPVQAIVASSASSHLLGGTALPFRPIMATAGSDLLLDDLFETDVGATDVEEISSSTQVSDSTPLGFYNSLTPFTDEQALTLGMSAADHFRMSSADRVCVSITLCHAFGIGSACASALQSGATVVLPAVGGIHGCGVPSKRAEATYETLETQACTILFADTHTLKALPPCSPGALPALRAGVVKVGSGSDFLDDTREYGGVQFSTLGKRN